MHWSIFQLNLRHRWTSKSCPPSLPWHKVCKPPQGVVERKLSPPDGGHLGCGIWQRLPRFPPSPVTLCLHLHYSADPPHPKKNPLSLCGGESLGGHIILCGIQNSQILTAIELHLSLWHVPILLIGSLSKPRRWQRERHKAKGLMSRTIAVHVRYKSLYIS